MEVWQKSPSAYVFLLLLLIVVSNRVDCFVTGPISFPAHSKASSATARSRSISPSHSNEAPSSWSFLILRSSSSSESVSVVSSSSTSSKSTPWRVEPHYDIEYLEQHAPDEFVNSIVDQATSFQTAKKDILRQYKPQRFWLWKQWSGTILQHGSKKALVYMTISAIISLVLKRVAGGSWVIPGAIDNTSVLAVRMNVFNKVWHYSMTLTTFLLTFFVSQAYTFWRAMYSTGRKVQGRLNDFGMLLATHTKRISTANDAGKYTKEGAEFLGEVSSFVRLFSPFLWAANSRKFRVLLTDRGMQRMVDKEFLSSHQMTILQSLDVPRKQYSSVCLEWIIARTIKAEAEGVLVENTESMMHTFLHEACQLRAAANGIPDDLDGRMPLVYAHFVQILVDWLVLGAPLALFAELGSMSILCVGILTLFYEGMLDLAKVFLDPLENEDYCDGGIEMDLGVLMRESNMGSIRWKNGAAELPF